jgi:NADP-dependent 3-hydroxy acid dehydrogenase YdfG
MFKDKVIIVTGSVQGIGKRTAELLAERGAKVVINSRTAAKVDATVEEFTTKGHDVLGITGDISDFDFCEEMKNQTVTKYGRVDYLINNAGLAAKGTISDTQAHVYKKMYDVNVLGSLYPTMVFLPEIKKTKGGVLFISSMAGNHRSTELFCVLRNEAFYC